MLSMQTLLGWRTPEGEPVVSGLPPERGVTTTTTEGEAFLDLVGLGFLYINFSDTDAPEVGVYIMGERISRRMPDTLAELEAWARMVGAVYRSGQ